MILTVRIDLGHSKWKFKYNLSYVYVIIDINKWKNEKDLFRIRINNQITNTNTKFYSLNKNVCSKSYAFVDEKDQIRGEGEGNIAC